MWNSKGKGSGESCYFINVMLLAVFQPQNSFFGGGQYDGQFLRSIRRKVILKAKS